jgi:hypothetical protein
VEDMAKIPIPLPLVLTQIETVSDI